MALTGRNIRVSRRTCTAAEYLDAIHHTEVHWSLRKEIQTILIEKKAENLFYFAIKLIQIIFFVHLQQIEPHLRRISLSILTTLLPTRRYLTSHITRSSSSCK
jgi:hypothetical protein